MGTLYDRDLAQEYAIQYEIAKEDGEELWRFRVRVARLLFSNKLYAEAHAVLWNEAPIHFVGEGAMSLERGNDAAFVEELARRVEALLTRYRREQACRVQRQQRGFLFTKVLLRWLRLARTKEGQE